MPQRSSVVALPELVRQELERKLIAVGFAGYQDLVNWLAEQGYEISRSALHRFGKGFQERYEMLLNITRQAQELKAALPDDEAAVSEMGLQVAQSLLFQLVMERGEELSPKEMALVTRALTEASKGTVAVKRYQTEVRGKLEALEAEANQGKKALDPETLRYIRETIYGL